jgi:hypothetical protein
MFSELAKLRTFQAAAIFLPLLGIGFFALKAFGFPSAPSFFSAAARETDGSDRITRMRASLQTDRALLIEYEQNQSRLRTEVITKRKLHHDGQISQEEVKQAEQAFVAALNQVYAMRHAVLETDIAITEAVLGEKVARMPVLPVNGFSESTDATRFNGGFKWSLKEAPRIERYFTQSFGRPLPVTALGQSETHNRLGFDHHDAMDIAVHPDSTEGKALIRELRKMGVPFIAFRGAAPGASTGPHIHVGRPSGRVTRG